MSHHQYRQRCEAQALYNAYLPRSRTYPPTSGPVMTVPSLLLQERVWISIRSAETTSSSHNTLSPAKEIAMGAFERLAPAFEHIRRSLVKAGWTSHFPTAPDLALDITTPVSNAANGYLRPPLRLRLPRNAWTFMHAHGMCGWANPTLPSLLSDLALEEPAVLDLLRLLQCICTGGLQIVISTWQYGRVGTPRLRGNKLPDEQWLLAHRGVVERAVGRMRFQDLWHTAREIEASSSRTPGHGGSSTGGMDISACWIGCLAAALGA